jgi:magnesium transporter
MMMDHAEPSAKSVHFEDGGAPGGAPPSASAKLLPASKQPRRWVAVNAAGEAVTVELSKMRVHHQLGVQLRDLRLLDPSLATSYPSAILARERALVLNLEYIKAIVAMDRVYITNLEEPHTLAFIEELQRRLAAPSHAMMGASPSAGSLAALASGPLPSGGFPGGPPTAPALPPGAAGVAGLHGLAAPYVELPFELRALECALDVICGYLERLNTDLEAAAHPALDALTQKISTSNLERVRRIKNRMVRLTTRVETLKELLEKLLDDDSDMRDVNLSAKEAEREELLHRHAARAASASASATPFDVPLRAGAGADGGGLASPLTPKSPASSVSSDSEDDTDVAPVEMLLEPYFQQVDNTWNKLQTLSEYIDDTEDFINIELDSHRNQLIRLDLVLTSFATTMAFITAMTSLFAMNVRLTPSGQQAPYSWFLVISIGCACVAVLSFAAVMAYSRWKRLL